MTSQPCSASFRQNSSVTVAGSAMLCRTNWVVHSLSRNRRALSRSSSCSSVYPMSILQSRLSLPLTLPPLRDGPLILSAEPERGRGRGAIWALSPRQAQYALADDVALDLAGAAGDRVLPGAEHAVVPARRIRHCFRRCIDRRVGAEQGRREIGNAQRQLRTEQFEDRAFGARRLAAQPTGQATQPCHLQGFDVNGELRQLLADVALVPGRLLAAWELFCELGEPRDLRGMIAPTGAAALEHQRRDRDLPAPVQRAYEVFFRDGYILEKHLVEVAVAVEQHERPHRDPRRFHVDKQVADAVMLRRAGVGAHQQEAPVCEMRSRGPYFLSVDDKIVAAVDGACAQTGEIPARVGFGIALAPQLVGAQNPRQVALFLFLGAPMDQGRAQ